jgi:glutamyl-tRNA synthetase
VGEAAFVAPRRAARHGGAGGHDARRAGRLAPLPRERLRRLRFRARRFSFWRSDEQAQFLTVTRFAPSPSGFLHLGGARTALYNWLIARRDGGEFILRIEDTDQARSSGESAEQILESLRWLGLHWDAGPFYQSARSEIYLEHLKLLQERDRIYPAFETIEELEAERRRAVAEKRSLVYDGPSRYYAPDEARRRIDAGDPYVWRFRVPREGEIAVPETLMNKDGVVFQNKDIGDFAITRPSTHGNFGSTLYNLSCVVDDALMKITHIVRGVEHLSNSPKQCLLYDAFGYAPPRFTHLPLLLKNKKKMSKRDAEADPMYPVSVLARRDLGYLPEATVNFLSLLGWSHPEGKELFDVEHLKQVFSVKRLVRSNANFDEDKYLHINAWHIRNKTADELADLVIPFLQRAGFALGTRGRDELTRIIVLHRDRCRTLAEFVEALRYFFERPSTYDAAMSEKFLKGREAARVISDLRTLLTSLDVGDQAETEKEIRQFAVRNELKLVDVSQLLRVALTGRSVSPGIFDVMALLGQKELIARLDAANAYTTQSLDAHP